MRKPASSIVLACLLGALCMSACRDVPDDHHGKASGGQGGNAMSEGGNAGIGGSGAKPKSASAGSNGTATK